MGRYCFLCEKCYEKNVSMHKFPKNVHVRREWMRVCELDEKIDNVTSLFLCSYHFRPEDYNAPLVQNKCRKQFLKPNAIPSLRLPGAVFKEENEEINKENSRSSRKVHSDENMEISAQATSECASSSYISHEADIEENLGSFVKVEIDENVEISEQGTSAGASSSYTAREADVTETVSTPKSRRSYEPRFVGEILLDDLLTPGKAERVLQMIKRTDMAKSHKIKLLQDRIRNLLKKVTNLQQLVQNLQKEKVISKNGQDSSMVNRKPGLSSVRAPHSSASTSAQRNGYLSSSHRRYYTRFFPPSTHTTSPTFLICRATQHIVYVSRTRPILRVRREGTRAVRAIGESAGNKNGS